MDTDLKVFMPIFYSMFVLMSSGAGCEDIG